MRFLGLPFLDRLRALAPLALRLAVGLVFVVHGWDKLQGGPAEGFGGFLASLGVPAPELTGWLVTIAELVGGAMLLLGLLTRLVALPLIATMIGAIVLVKAEVGVIAAEGVGAEIDIALLGGLVALLLIGPGSISVDRAIGVERTSAPADAGARTAA